MATVATYGDFVRHLSAIHAGERRLAAARGAAAAAQARADEEARALSGLRSELAAYIEAVKANLPEGDPA